MYLTGELGVALWIYCTPSLECECRLMLTVIADIHIAKFLPGPESDTGSLALHGGCCQNVDELNDKLT